MLHEINNVFRYRSVTFGYFPAIRHYQTSLIYVGWHRSSASRNATMDPTSALQRICTIHGNLKWWHQWLAPHFKFHPYSFLVRTWKTFGLASLTAILCAVNASAYGGVLSYANGDWYNGWWLHNSPIGQISIQYQTPVANLVCSADHSPSNVLTASSYLVPTSNIGPGPCCVNWNVRW